MSAFTALAAQGIVLLAIVAILAAGLGYAVGTLRASRSTSSRYEQQLRATLRRMSDAEADGVTLRAQLSERDGELAARSTERDSQEHLLAALEARLAETQPVAPPTTVSVAPSDPTDSDIDAMIDSIEANGAPPSDIALVAARTAGSGPRHHDDLTRIKGIGKVIARTLTDLDITSYVQVARLSSDDIAIVEGALEAFPGRIERDDWMSSATALHKEVHGADI